MLKTSFVISAATLLFALTGCSTMEKDDPAAASMFRGDPARSGFYETAEIAGPLELKWQFKTGGRVFSSAAVDNNMAFFGSEDGGMYAVDLESGQAVWKFVTGGAVHSSPAVVEGKLFFGSADGSFYALESKTGKLLWKFETGGEKLYSAKGLFGLKPSEEILPDTWDFFLSSPAIAEGVVYFGSGDGSIYALEKESGKQIWKFNTGDVVHASPVVAGGKVYIGGWDTYLYALDALTGNEIWRFKTGDDPEHHLMTGIQGSPAVADSRVFFGGRDACFYALDAATGNQIWKFETSPSWVVASPAVYQGTVYFGTSDTHRFFALDAASGDKKFDFDAKTFVFSSAAVTETAVYFGSFNGKLYALDRNSGNELWQFTTEASRRDKNSLLLPDGGINASAFGQVVSSEDMRLAVEKLHSVGSILTSPVICRDMLLFGSADSFFYALH